MIPSDMSFGWLSASVYQRGLVIDSQPIAGGTKETFSISKGIGD